MSPVPKKELEEEQENNEGAQGKPAEPILRKAAELKHFIIKILPAAREVDQPFPPVNIANLGPMGRLMPKRNTFIPVSQAYTEALDHTTYTEWVDVGEGDNKHKEPVEKMRIPYSVVCEITKQGHDILRP